MKKLLFSFLISLLSLQISYGMNNENNGEQENNIFGRETSLHIAVNNNDIETIKIRIKYFEHEINTKYINNTPLLLACKKGNLEATQLLLDNNADPSLRDHYERSCFHNAARSGNLPIMELLWPHFKDNVDHSDNDKTNALMIAAQNHHTHIIKYLLTKGANPNHVNRENRNALHQATCRGPNTINREPVETVKILIKKNVNIIIDQYDKTPLHYAIESGYTEVLKLLLACLTDRSIQKDLL
jgi:ankyrin repeat protein